MIPESLNSVAVGAVAPAVFSGAILKRADNSLATAGNPAQAGDVLVVYLTGMGQTTPALASGRLVDASRTFTTAPVTVTLGGKDAEVLSSVAAPGLPGLYQVMLRVPAGAGTGNIPLVLRAGTTSSNTVSVAVRQGRVHESVGQPSLGLLLAAGCMGECSRRHHSRRRETRRLPG